MNRSLTADLASLNETLLLIDTDQTASADVKARLTENVKRTIERLQDVEFLVPGLYDYSGTNAFLVSVRDQVHLGQKPLSDKQIAAAGRALSRQPAQASVAVARDVNKVLFWREDNAMEVVRNSGRTRQAALKALSDPSVVQWYASRESAYQAELHFATNRAIGKCADGCCGGQEAHATYLSWVQELEQFAASLIEEDAA